MNGRLYWVGREGGCGGEQGISGQSKGMTEDRKDSSYVSEPCVSVRKPRTWTQV